MNKQYAEDLAMLRVLSIVELTTKQIVFTEGGTGRKNQKKNKKNKKIVESDVKIYRKTNKMLIQNWKFGQ